jgi:hypothetical protein
MALTEKEIEKHIEANPNVGFDICSCCGATQEHNTMKEVCATGFELICEKCDKC